MAKPNLQRNAPANFRPVQSLSGEDIGKIIRFYAWNSTREIAQLTTAELRQISHSSDRTTLYFGVGANEQETLEPGEQVSLDPPFDLSDAVELRQRFCDFHAITEDLL